MHAGSVAAAVGLLQVIAVLSTPYHSLGSSILASSSRSKHTVKSSLSCPNLLFALKQGDLLRPECGLLLAEFWEDPEALGGSWVAKESLGKPAGDDVGGTSKLLSSGEEGETRGLDSCKVAAKL